MASFQRIALYLTFDALERDLIRLIRRSVSVNILTEQESSRARDRILKRDRQDLYNLNDEFDLLHGLDLGDKFNILLRQRTGLSDADAKYFLALKLQFDKAVPIRNDVMHGRPLTVDDYAFGFSFGSLLSKRRDMWPELSKTLVELNNDLTSVVSRPISTIESDVSTAVLNNLPRVDYDDTGFMPRPKLEAELKKKILGRHPVITVLGDGGNGKTALILQTAYHLIYSQDHDFDAIIWVSAKNSELTVAEIKRISNAIVTSVEVFEKIAEFEPGADDPIVRVRKLLSENKILLIIDNLETVLDPKIRVFAEDIPGESKLVFTSRVPLGGDLSVKVDAFTESEAERFLRRLIEAYHIEVLRKCNTSSLQRYIKILNYKPLLIKWFALGVLSGLAPEKIARDPEIALRFCLENVINTLPDEAKNVALTFAVIPGSHSALIVQHLTQLSARQVEAGLATLLRYSLITDESEQDQERTYAMSVFVKAYLTRIEKMQPAVVERFREQARQIQSMFESRRSDTSINRYAMHHYTVRSRSEAIAAAQISHAFSAFQRGETEKALRILEDLKITTPEYFEVYRVAAFCCSEIGDMAAAEQNYEMAVDIDASQPQLFLWYAGFAMRRLQDSAKASELFDSALKIDPESSILLREAARNELFVPDFNRAQAILDRAKKIKFNIHKDNVIIYDLQAQLYIRRATALMQGGNFIDSVNDLVSLRSFVDGLSKSYIDQRFVEHLSRGRHFCVKQLEFRAPNELQSKVKELAEWFNRFVGAPAPIPLH
jgi:LuxR family transcriptional regulator, glucitol operon activator